MIIKSAEFVKSATKPSQYPPEALPEIAFAGRSNVGKSSLINTLLNRKRLVKTGSTPGRTQLLNFFNINQSFTFVDLPGYGYAKVPVNIRKQWGLMIETFLTARNTLRGVVTLFDIRRNPGQMETDLLDWLIFQDIHAIPILTKADKFKRGRQNERRRQIANALGRRAGDFILFSAKTGQGKEALWTAIEQQIPPADASAEAHSDHQAPLKNNTQDKQRENNR